MTRIAIPYENGQIFQRFGHAPQFKFCDVVGNRIIREQVITAPSKKGHAALVSFLRTLSTNTLICDRIGEGGQQALRAAGIEVHSGITGNADDAVKELIEGKEDKRNVHLDVPISFY